MKIKLPWKNENKKQHTQHIKCFELQNELLSRIVMGHSSVMLSYLFRYSGKSKGLLNS